MLHATPISLFSIWSPEQRCVRSTDHYAPHYLVFSTPVTSLLGPNILLRTLFSKTLSLRSSLNVSDKVSYPYKTTHKIIVMYILIFKVLDSKLEDKWFCPEWQQAFPDFNLLLIYPWMEFRFVRVVFKYMNCSTLSKNYYQFLYCDFIAHSDLETWPCT